MNSWLQLLTFSVVHNSEVSKMDLLTVTLKNFTLALTDFTVTHYMVIPRVQMGV